MFDALNHCATAATIYTIYYDSIGMKALIQIRAGLNIYDTLRYLWS